MQKLIGLFQDSVRMVYQGQASQLSKYYQNKSIDQRVKSIMRKVQKIHNRGENEFILIELFNFKDLLSKNDTVGIQMIINNSQWPKMFSEVAREIYELFQRKNGQLTLIENDCFFYKDIMKAAVNGKDISEEQIKNKSGISQDKLSLGIDLIRKVNGLKGQKVSGAERDKNKQNQKQEQQSIISLLKINQKELNEKMKKNSEEVKKERQLRVPLEKELNQKKEELKALAKKMNKLKQEFLKEKTTLMKEAEFKLKGELQKLKQYESLCKKLQNQAKDLAEKKQLIKEFQSLLIEKDCKLKEVGQKIQNYQSILNSKQMQIQLLRRSVKQSKPLAQLEAKDKHIKELEKELQKLKKQNKHLEKASKSNKMNQQKIADYENRIKKFEAQKNKLQELQIQHKSELINREKQIKGLYQELQKSKIKNMSTASDNSFLNNQLFQRTANTLLQTAEKFNQIYSQSSFSLKQSSLRHSQVKPQKIQLREYLKGKFLIHQKFYSDLIKQLKQPKQTSELYLFPEDKNVKFKSQILTKKNLLVICLTKSGGIIGGYSQHGFERIKEGQSNKCLIFSAKGQNCIILRNKKGKSGIIEDNDFLIFGNEELTLGQNSSYAAVELEQNVNSFDFEGTLEDRQKFIGIVDGHHQIQLVSYSILQLVFPPPPPPPPPKRRR